jgi:hypothetical protein
LHEKIEEGTPAVNQWVLINRTLQVYRAVAMAIGLVALLTTILAIYHATANPVVVVEKCNAKSFYEGNRTNIKVTDDDVKAFIEGWIRLRYTWTEYDPEKIVRAIAPMTTEGLQEKLKDQLNKKAAEAAKNGKAQKIETSVANIKVTLSDKDAVASFDQIVRINGIPIVVPSEIAFQIVQEIPTQWNPLGLYVNGVLEREEK